MLSITSRLSSRSVPSSLSLLRSYSSSPPSLDDSHDDFAPKMKGGDSSNPDLDKALSVIKSHVTENPVMLYMKGSPAAPQCGFSARVVGILKNHSVNFSSVNVLEYPSIREGVKAYSDWPTVPQLYVAGEFVGGCDIVEGMAEDGELKELFEKEGVEKSEE